jgi:hypothetical protein
MDGNTRGRLRPVMGRTAGGANLVEPRRNRDSLFLLARVRIGDTGDWAEIRVRNLSAGGLMAEIGEALAIETPIELELRGIGHVVGRVAWQTEGRTGIAFDTEIDPLKARKPVGRSRPAAAASPARR